VGNFRKARMKIYVMTDMEGVAGVVNSDDFLAPGARYYEVARELVTGEVNAAIEGALEAGATEFLVLDGHGHGAINPTLLHPAARLLTGRPLGYPFGIDESFAAAFMIGQHAKANTDGGHLAHTGSFAIEDLTINGRSVGEMGCNMLVASAYGVPYVLHTGDAAASAEARDLVPAIETVSVKWGVPRGSATGLDARQNELFNGAATHLHPMRARTLIREAATRALERRQEITGFQLAPPYHLVSVRRKTDSEPAKTAHVEADDIIEVLRRPRQHR
jgi:D-amino peptidase